jgi:hypothetical protein
MRLVSLVALAALLCAEASAFAQQGPLLGIITANTRTVTAVMQRETCHPGWLSKVLDDSWIDPAKMRDLPIGQKIYFDGDCQRMPPESVAARSEEIVATLAPPKPRKLPAAPAVIVAPPPAPEPKPDPPVAATSGQPESPEPVPSPIPEEKVSVEVRDLRKANEDMRLELREATKGLFSLTSLVVSGASGFALGLLLGALTLASWQHYHHRKNESSPNNRIKYNRDPNFDK